MTKARDVIRSALTFHLNRLAPGETEDAELFATCLRALNDIADAWNGEESFLFRTVLTASAAPISGVSATLGSNWPTLAPGLHIDGASITVSPGTEQGIAGPLTMEQYQAIIQKATSGQPQAFAYDGAATVYFYPAATGQTVTLRTREALTEFADLDTDYVMPKGYRSALAACVAETLAPAMLGGVPPAIMVAARAARNRIGRQASNPAIIGGGRGMGNILSGWN